MGFYCILKLNVAHNLLLYSYTGCKGNEWLYIMLGLNLIIFSKKGVHFFFCSRLSAYTIRDNEKKFTSIILSYKDLILFPKKKLCSM